MQSINIFYFVVFLVGMILWSMSMKFSAEVQSFFGVAESQEFVFKRGFDVAVDKIHIIPGQLVKKGDLILEYSRVSTAPKLSNEQDYYIRDLKAKEEILIQTKLNELQSLKDQKQLEIGILADEISKKQEYINNKKEILGGFAKPSVFIPLENELKALEQQKERQQTYFDNRITAIQKDVNTNKSPYKDQISRLRAEKKFEKDIEVIRESMFAPYDGLIGDIMIVENSKASSYEPLLTMYRNEPSRVKGYVHEDLRLQVAVNDTFLVSSNKDRTNLIKGIVTGMGKRIVGIPMRLSRVPDRQLYGIEIMISLPPHNDFILGEKVILELHKNLGSPEASVSKEKYTNLAK